MLGAGGMLGRAVLTCALEEGGQATGSTHDELDICDEASVAQALGRHDPEVVINCAAWTDVDGAQSDPRGAHLVNAAGAGVVARAVARSDGALVHVSTDYVFDGRGSRPYVESDPTAPATAYGESKLEGERQVRASSDRHTIVRTAWLFGAGGANFVDTMLRLAGEGRDELRVVSDQVGCPTWTGHLAPALLAVARARPGGVLHVAGAGSCTWNELAREVFSRAGYALSVAPATSEEMRRPAPRPPYSVLGSEREEAPRLVDWRVGVEGHLRARGLLASPAVVSGVRGSA